MQRNRKGAYSPRLECWRVVLACAIALAIVPIGATVAWAQSTMFFADVFSSDVLSELWYWEREDPAMWSLTANPGHLRIMTQEGTLWGDGTAPRNLLLTGISSSSDFQIDVRLIFQPLENFHEAGIAIYEDSSNYVLLGRAFCGHEIQGCVGNGVYVDHEYRGEMQDDPAPIPWQADEAYLRVQKQGTTYTFFVSDDGESWTQMGAVYGFPLVPTAVGLYAYSEFDIDSIPADFDYFRISPLH